LKDLYQKIALWATFGFDQKNVSFEPKNPKKNFFLFVHDKVIFDSQNVAQSRKQHQKRVLRDKKPLEKRQKF